MTFVFDAQALIAYALDEPGADVMEEILNRVREGERPAWCSVVNLAELRYVLLRRSPESADGFVSWCIETGIQQASVDDVWPAAARIKANHTVSLADAFALATAASLDATLVTGRDPDFDVAPSVGVRLLRIGT